MLPQPRPRIRRRATALLLAATLIAGLLAGGPARAAESVSLTLDWVLNGTIAGYFAAEKQGYYRDAGLDVAISRGFGSGDTIKRVAAGSSTMGVADSAAIITAIANENLPVRIVAVIYQNSSLGMIYLAESGIKLPRDLEGRAIGRSASGASVNMFPGFLKANNIDRSKIREVVVDGSTFLSILMSRQVDAVLENSLNIGKFARMAAAQGLTAKSMRFSDFGLEAYSNALIVSTSTLQEKPDMVRRFVAAALKGNAEALRHPDEAIAAMRENHPEVDAEVSKDELTALRDVVVTDATRKAGIGAISADRMTATRDVVTAALGLKRVVPLEEIYTTTMLPATPVLP